MIANTVFVPRSKDKIEAWRAAMVAGAPLSAAKLQQALYYPAAGGDFTSIKQNCRDIRDFIHVDINLMTLFALYGRRRIGGWQVKRRKLTTLDQLTGRCSVTAAPYITRADERIAACYHDYPFANGRLRTMPERTPVGVFELATKHGTRRLFYVVNEGYWTYLFLFDHGNIAPARLFMKTGGMGAKSAGIPCFEDEQNGLCRITTSLRPGNMPA